ncbi:NAD(P)H-dependent oxidoreductase [Clostridium sp. Mt-5]|uniref:NAD(P)H-dependent oxidoreductase n=1 Tax=Clostridium moutaii TaxID=3240932 RepID=A0ABV4BLZ1_9CLOT
MDNENVKEQVLKAYSFRHACKEFDGSKKISDDDFNYILEVGKLSPSSFGFIPWKFLILQNAEIRQKISPVSWGAELKLPDASHFIVILSRKTADLIYSSKYISYIMENVQKLPQNVIDKRKKGYENFQKNDFKLLENDRAMFDWGCKQTYIALGNMMTAAALIGIDSCPIEGFNRDKVEEILSQEGILDREKFGVSCMVAFGYRKKAPRPKTRPSLDKLVEWIR